MEFFKRYIVLLRQSAFLLFTLFALSSCVVKGAMLKVAHLDYAKPINQTKALVANSCSSSVENAIHFSSITNDQVATEPDDYGCINFSRNVRDNATPTLNLATTLGNSPPRYILFKRLKISVV